MPLPSTPRCGRRLAVVVLGFALTAPIAPTIAQEPAGDTYIYGGDANFAPYEYLDDTGEPRGFNIDLLRELAATAGVRVEFRLGAWHEQMAALRAGTVDLISMAHSEAREREFAFGPSTWTLSQAVVFLPGRSHYPQHLDELGVEVVAALASSLMAELLRSLPEVRRPVIVDTLDQEGGVRLLQSGAVTAVAGNELTLQIAARKLRIPALELRRVKTVTYHLAARRDRHARLAWVAPALERVKKDYRLDRLVERHLVVPQQGGDWAEYQRSALSAAAGASILAAGIVFWNRSLKRQVRARDRAVQRTARLQQLAAGLSTAATSSEVMEVVLHHGITSLGAQAALVGQAAPVATARADVHAHGFSGALVAEFADPDGEGHRLLIDPAGPAEVVVAAPGSDSMRRFFELFDGRTIAFVPLILHGHPAGLLVLGFTGDRAMDSEDREFALALGRQAALALERSRLYEAERTARAQAEQASRLKDEFLATLSHELRTPLNAIVGWSHILRTRAADAQTLARGLASIERNAQVQTQLVADLLDVSRIESGQLLIDNQAVELVRIVEAAVDAVRPTAGAKGVQVLTAVEAPDAVVTGDRARLHQVVWNLLSNAVKFTESGGSIQVGLRREAGTARITVQDSGIGIAPEFLPHVFERFRQGDASTTRRHGGLGLGLAIVRQLVDLHGGRVTAASEGHGRGSLFTVELPLATRPVRRERTGPPPLAARLTNLTVLVVDDEVETRELLATILQESGARAIAVASVDEALAAFDREQPDVVVSDIAMPGRDGYDLVRMLRQRTLRRGRVAAVALTAHAGAADRQRALAAGYDAHLTKPLEPSSLVTTLAAVSRGQQIGT